MTIGAYRDGPGFAYPGWRLTVPGGPAGGHYKGFTHTQAAGTTILPEDQYELDRGDGMSSHDRVHASPANPRGVYRSSGEVPPRPNASGAAHTYRGFQTRRHAGTSVAPGSFPADFHETGEDDFLSLAENAPHYLKPEEAAAFLGAEYVIGDGFAPIGARLMVPRPNTAICSEMIQSIPPGYQRVQVGTDPNGCPVYHVVPIPSTGATSTVSQPVVSAPDLPILPPAPSVPVSTAPPVSPTPAPIVATNEVVPVNDGSGNYINLSTGQIIPASAVTQNLATMQLTASPTSSALSWLEEPSSFFPSIPNWGLLAAGLGAAALLMGRHR